MADVSTISVLLQAKDQVSATLERVERRMGGLAGAVRRHQRGLGIAATATGAALTGLATIAVKGALDQEIGIRSLDQALKNVGFSYARQRDEIEKVIESQQRKTNFGDEQQREALQKLVAIGGKYEGSLEALVVAQDFAAGSSMDLQSAALLVGKAIAGETSTLSRYGIIMEEGATITDIMATLTAKFGGAAEAAANPMTQLKNRIGDLFETIGLNLLPQMEKALISVEKFVRSMIAWTEAHPILTKAIVVIAASLGVFLAVVGPILLILPGLILAIKGLSIAFVTLNASMGVISAVVMGITAAILVGMAVWKNWDKIIALIKKGFTEFAILLPKGINAILKMVRAVADLIPGMDGMVAGIDKSIAANEEQISSMRASADATMEKAFRTEEADEKVKESAKKTAVSVGESNSSIESTSQKMAEGVSGSTQSVSESYQETGRVVRTEAEKQAQSVKESTEIIAESLALREMSHEEFVESIKASNEEYIKREQELTIALAKEQEKRIQTEAQNAQHEIEIRQSNREFEIQAAKDAYAKLREEGDKWREDYRAQVEEENRINEDRIANFAKVSDEVIQSLKEMQSTSIMIEDPWMDDMGITQQDMFKGQADAIREKEIKAEEERIAAETKAKLDPFVQQLKDTGTDAHAFNMMFNQVKQHAGFMQEEKIAAEAAGITGAAKTAPGSAAFQAAVDQLIGQQAPGTTLDASLRAIQAGVYELPKFANGGISRGGLALVGERGPELVSLPGGSRVHPNGSGPGGGMTFHFHGAVYGVDDLQRVVVEAVRDHALSGGFQGVFAEG